MEDSHTHILSLPDDPATAFFGVYDGHGGAKVADFVGKNLHKYVINQKEYRKGNYIEALKKAFMEIDEVMYDVESLKSEQSGSTAVTVMVRENQLFCANIGDSRAIASVSGKVERLSYDHKPSNPEEYERINDAGGWVDCNRVNGNLALSRAFGDYIFKRNKIRPPEEQIVIALPDVIQKTVTPEWDFVVLACDGIWDVMSNEDVLNFVIENIANGLEPEEICENLMMRCLAPDCQMAGLGCDNMTVVLVVFLHGGSYDDVIAKCVNYTSNVQIYKESLVQDSIKEVEQEMRESDDKLKICATKVCAANASVQDKAEA